MDKLALLDTLIEMVQEGNLELLDESQNAETVLWDIKLTIQRVLQDEVMSDITKNTLTYYAPEYPSWREYLEDCNGNSDYKKVLQNFDEHELDELWQNSHISEDLNEQQIKEEMVMQIGQLKMLEIVGRKLVPANSEQHKRMVDYIRARLIGLYNMLYD